VYLHEVILNEIIWVTRRGKKYTSYKGGNASKEGSKREACVDLKVR